MQGNKLVFFGVPVVAQQKWILLASMRTQVRSLALLSGLRIQHCHELWCRPAATAPLWPLAWKAPYATRVALKNNNDNKNKLIFFQKVVFFSFFSFPFLSFFFFFFFIFRAAPIAYGGSQAKGSNWSCSYSLHHSHSNARSLTHRVRPEIKPASSWIPVGFVTHWATMGTPKKTFFKHLSNMLWTWVYIFYTKYFA